MQHTTATLPASRVGPVWPASVSATLRTDLPNHGATITPFVQQAHKRQHRLGPGTHARGRAVSSPVLLTMLRSPALSDRTVALHHRDHLDRAIELASGATAAGMFAYGVALSYSVLHAIAAAAGLPTWAARLWPLGFEAFMASAALNALAEQRHRRHLPAWSQRVPWYPWTLTGLTAGASILLNWLHPAIPLDPPPGWLV
jgi:Protein of unknown function (DUF2637)